MLKLKHGNSIHMMDCWGLTEGMSMGRVRESNGPCCAVINSIHLFGTKISASDITCATKTC